MTTIAYMSIVNFIVTTLFSQILSRILPRYKSSSGVWNYFKLAIVVSLIASLAFGCRQISEKFPMIPIKSESFDPVKVKEVKGSVLTAFTFFMWLGENVKEYKPILSIGS